MQQNFWVLLPVHKKTNTITSKCNDISSVDEAFLWFISLAIAFAESLSILAKLVASKFEKTVLISKEVLLEFDGGAQCVIMSEDGDLFSGNDPSANVCPIQSRFCYQSWLKWLKQFLFLMSM